MIISDYEELQVVFNQWSKQSGRCPFHQDARSTKMPMPPTRPNSFEEDAPFDTSSSVPIGHKLNAYSLRGQNSVFPREIR
ncbi:MAG: hypothetical protein F6K26_45790 [Moorea sp. SIO2I5]|nr:hypothetical protein [Moorena sp. SIO2I5]